MEAALKPFGWGVSGVFWERYYSDPWVFNLANAVERLNGVMREALDFLVQDEPWKAENVLRQALNIKSGMVLDQEAMLREQ